MMYRRFSNECSGMATLLMVMKGITVIALLAVATGICLLVFR
ncbi:TPA: hypothetical protein ACNEZX_002490 [Escherichia coli]